MQLQGTKRGGADSSFDGRSFFGADVLCGAFAAVGVGAEVGTFVGVVDGAFVCVGVGDGIGVGPLVGAGDGSFVGVGDGVFVGVGRRSEETGTGSGAGADGRAFVVANISCLSRSSLAHVSQCGS